MGSSRDRLAVNLVLAVLVSVGVSGAVSPWLDAFYGEIAFWTVIAIGPVVVIAGLVWWFDFDRSLDREAAESWKVNGETVRELAAKHAAHPEVARELAARMAKEKARQEQLRSGGVQPPASGS